MGFTVFFPFWNINATESKIAFLVMICILIYLTDTNFIVAKKNNK